MREVIQILAGVVGFLVFLGFLFFGIPWILQASIYNDKIAAEYFQGRK